MKIEIEIPREIRLRYHNGWCVVFFTVTERFFSPILCLFGFLSIPDLEKAIDRAIEYRKTGK